MYDTHEVTSLCSNRNMIRDVIPSTKIPNLRVKHWAQFYPGIYVQCAETVTLINPHVTEEVSSEPSTYKIFSPVTTLLIMRCSDQMYQGQVPIGNLKLRSTRRGHMNTRWMLYYRTCKRKVGETFNRYLRELKMGIILGEKVIRGMGAEGNFNPPPCPILPSTNERGNL